MTVCSAALVAFSLLGGMDEPPASPPEPGGGLAPETRVEPDRSNDPPAILGRLMIGVRFHGPRIKVQGEGTRERPLVIDLPIGDLLRLRLVMPDGRMPLSDGNIYY